MTTADEISHTQYEICAIFVHKSIPKPNINSDSLDFNKKLKKPDLKCGTKYNNGLRV